MSFCSARMGDKLTPHRSSVFLLALHILAKLLTSHFFSYSYHFPCAFLGLWAESQWMGFWGIIPDKFQTYDLVHSDEKPLHSSFHFHNYCVNTSRGVARCLSVAWCMQLNSLCYTDTTSIFSMKLLENTEGNMNGRFARHILVTVGPLD